MSDDTLSRVALTSSAVERWKALARRPETLAKLRGLPPVAIPDELARVEADGSLTIYVPLPEGRGEIAMRVEAPEWAWRGQQNQ